MSKTSTRSTQAGIIRPVWEGPRARPDRIAVFKLTGFPSIGEAFSAAFKIPPELPRLWKVQVGNRAHVATEDLGRIHSVHTFAEATALADEIRRRGEAFHRLERMMPSRLRPRPRHTQFERQGHEMSPYAATQDEIFRLRRSRNHA